MKKIVTALFLSIPCLCWGQEIKTVYINPIIRYAETISLDISVDTDKVRSKISTFDMPLSGRLVSVMFQQQYEATVFDIGFDSFLATQKGKDYYSYNYLRGKNKLLVTEWNIRCFDSFLYDPKIYENKIDYDSNINYGKDVEYTLYMFFKFMEKKHGMNINTLAKL